MRMIVYRRFKEAEEISKKRLKKIVDEYVSLLEEIAEAYNEKLKEKGQEMDAITLLYASAFATLNTITAILDTYQNIVKSFIEKIENECGRVAG